MSEEPVGADEVRYALRGVRPAAFRVGVGTVALVMEASRAGRVNAAERIVRLLGEHGLELVAEDPVAALTERRDGVGVRRAGRGTR